MEIFILEPPIVKICIRIGEQILLGFRIIPDVFQLYDDAIVGYDLNKKFENQHAGLWKYSPGTVG